MISVFSCYKMPQANETESKKSQNDIEGFKPPEFQNPINDDALDNNQEEGGGDNNMKSNLRRAEQRIRELEKRLYDLEKRLPVKFEEVNFLNYQKKKRILVRKHLIVLS